MTAAGTFTLDTNTYALSNDSRFGTVGSNLTVSSGGSGAVSGTTFNGSSPMTISYNSVGAAALGGNTTQDFAMATLLFSGTWGSANWAIQGSGATLNFFYSGLSKATLTTSGVLTTQEIYRGSSRTIKHDIELYMGNAIEILNKTKIYTYRMNTDNSFGIGFIAEDTNKWLSGEEQKRHNFGNHLGLLTKAIQEENQQIIILKQEINNLKNQLENLTNNK